MPSRPSGRTNLKQRYAIKFVNEHFLISAKLEPYTPTLLQPYVCCSDLPVGEPVCCMPCSLLPYLTKLFDHTRHTIRLVRDLRMQNIHHRLEHLFLWILELFWILHYRDHLYATYINTQIITFCSFTNITYPHPRSYNIVTIL